MRTLAALLLASTFAVSFGTTTVLADDWHDRGHGHEHEEWHGGWHGDIHHFHEWDYDHWRGGRWYHGNHFGQFGWWWIVNGFWYSYPVPVYPYPDPYTPPVVVTEPVPVAPPGVAPSYVYYCPNPVGYYPYVPRCYHAWRRVSSTVVVTPPVEPPMMAAPPPPPAVAPAPMGDQRQIDDRKLNALAVEFQNIDRHSPHARARLKELGDDVEAFRQDLYGRQYNAMDILRDAEGLERRIAAERQGIK